MQPTSRQGQLQNRPKLSRIFNPFPAPGSEPTVRGLFYALRDRVDDDVLHRHAADTAHGRRAERVQRGVAEKLSLLIHSFYG